MFPREIVIHAPDQVQLISMWNLCLIIESCLLILKTTN